MTDHISLTVKWALESLLIIMSDFKWQFVFSMQDRGRFSMLGLGDIVSICHHHCLFVITAQVYNSILIKIVQTDILLLLHGILLPRSTKSRIFLKSWILCICSSTGPLLTVWQREGHYWTIAWREFIMLYFSSWRIFFHILKSEFFSVGVPSQP